MTSELGAEVSVGVGTDDGRAEGDGAREGAGGVEVGAGGAEEDGPSDP